MYDSDFENLPKGLQNMMTVMFHQYEEDQIKTNTEKCQLFLSPYGKRMPDLDNSKILSRKSEELLDILVNCKLLLIDRSIN